MNTTKDKIIEAAKTVFLKKGLDDTIMDEIAIEANITRRTVYRYFKTKEDLIYEIAIIFLSKWNDYQLQVFKQIDGKGILKLELFLKNLVSYMEDNNDVIKYLSEFDYYFRDGNISNISIEYLETIRKLSLVSEEILDTIINQGINDYTIIDTIDVRKTVYTISNVLWGFAQRIALRKEMIKSETKMNPLSLFNYQIDLYCQALRKGE